MNKSLMVSGIALALMLALAGPVKAQDSGVQNLSDIPSTMQSTTTPQSPSNGPSTTGKKGKAGGGVLNTLLGGSSGNSDSGANGASSPYAAGAGQNKNGGNAKEPPKKYRYRNIYGTQSIFGDMPMPQRVFNNVR